MVKNERIIKKAHADATAAVAAAAASAASAATQVPPTMYAPGPGGHSGHPPATNPNMDSKRPLLGPATNLA